MAEPLITPRLEAESTTEARRQHLADEHARRCGDLSAMLSGLLPAIAVRGSCVCEIGCGHGHFLEAYAAAHPGEFCVGIDFCADRIRRAQRKQARSREGNVAFVQAEAHEFLEALGVVPLRFRRVFVLFPDPWPKRRHRKNRLIAPEFLSRLAAVVEPDAALCFRTDSEDYFTHAAGVVAAHANWRAAPEVVWPFEHETVFQARAAAYRHWVALRRA